MTHDRQPVIERLSHIIDPELGLDIVSLGLIYDVVVRADELCVVMTLTFPGCPLIGYFSERVKDALKGLDEYANVSVKTVFEPAWSIEMIDPEARAGLGLPSAA